MMYVRVCMLLSSDKVFYENETCYLNEEPNNFTNPVMARYIRVIPIRWVGASACLRMQLYGCTVKGKATSSSLKFMISQCRVPDCQNSLG